MPSPRPRVRHFTPCLRLRSIRLLDDYPSQQYSTFSNETSPAVTSLSVSSSATTAYPTYSEIPVGRNYSQRICRLRFYNSTFSGRFPKPSEFHPRRHRLRQHCSDIPRMRHYQDRRSAPPEKGLPGVLNGIIREDDFSEERRAQEAIMQDIEAELSRTATTASPD